MEKPDTMEAYLAAVAEQIRWRRARGAVTRELRWHLEEQRDAFSREGRSIEEAERLAVAEMGDPVSVGAELDRLHRPRPQWGLLALTAALFLAGTALRLWAAALLRRAWPTVDPEPLRTLGAAALGCGVLAAAYLADARLLLRHAGWAYLAAVALGFLSLWALPHVNHAAYYTRYVVLLYPAVYATYLASLEGNGWKGVLLATASLAPMLTVCLLAPYLGGCVLLLTVGPVLLVFAAGQDRFGVGRRQGLTAVGGGALCLLTVGTAALWSPLQRRLPVLLHPQLDPMGRGYQAMAVRRALAGASWWGPGTWAVTDPVAEVVPGGLDGDFLLTTVICRLGWLPFLLLTAALTALAVWLLARGIRRADRRGQLLALTVGLTLGLQLALSAALNLGFVFASAHMPLVTGNLHSIVDMGLIGLALSVFRGASLPEAPSGDGGRQVLLTLRLRL